MGLRLVENITFMGSILTQGYEFPSSGKRTKRNIKSHQNAMSQKLSKTVRI